MSSVSNGESHNLDKKYSLQRALLRRLSSHSLKALSTQLTPKFSKLPSFSKRVSSKLKGLGVRSAAKSLKAESPEVKSLGSWSREGSLRTDSLKQKGSARWPSRDMYAIKRMDKVWAAVHDDPCRGYDRNPEWRQDSRYDKAASFKDLYSLRDSEIEFTKKRRNPPDTNCYNAVKELRALPPDLNNLCVHHFDGQCFPVDWQGEHECVMFKRAGEYYTPVRFSECARKATDEFLEKWKDSEYMKDISQWELENNPAPGVEDGSMSEFHYTWVDTEPMTDSLQEKLEEKPDPRVEDGGLPESPSESLRNSMSRSPMPRSSTPRRSMPRRSMTRSPVTRSPMPQISMPQRSMPRNPMLQRPMPQSPMPQSPMPRNPMNAFIPRTGTYNTIESQFTGPPRRGNQSKNDVFLASCSSKTLST